MGFKRVERNRSTCINLVNYSWERDEEADNLSELTLLVKTKIILETTTAIITTIITMMVTLHPHVTCIPHEMMITTWIPIIFKKD